MQPIPSVSFDKFQATLKFIDEQKYPFNIENLANKLKYAQTSIFLHEIKDQWEKGKVIDYVNNDSALHFTARKGYWTACAILVESGENPYQKNGAGKTAVDLALGIPIEFKNKIFQIAETVGIQNKEAPFIATRPEQGLTDEIGFLIQELIEIKDQYDLGKRIKKLSDETMNQVSSYRFPDGGTVLHEAARKGNKALVLRALYEGLGDRDVSDNEGNTFAHILAIHCNDLAPYWTDISSHFHKTNQQKKSVLHLLAAYNRYQTLQYANNWSSSILARAWGQDNEGNYYYHVAAAHGSMEFLRLIWENITQKEFNEFTKKHHCSSFEDQKKYCRLYSCFQKTNGQGQNILHIAALSGQKSIWVFLLQCPDLMDLQESQDKMGKKPRDYL